MEDTCTSGNNFVIGMDLPIVKYSLILCMHTINIFICIELRCDDFKWQHNFCAGQKRLSESSDSVLQGGE